MTPPPDDHTLNACLARVIGVEIYEDEIWYACNPVPALGWCLCGGIQWNPTHDPAQMELVEAWATKGHHIQYTKYVNQPKWGVSIWNDKGKIKGAGSDPDKKRAFALAIYAMDQARKETT